MSLAFLIGGSRGSCVDRGICGSSRGSVTAGLGGESRVALVQKSSCLHESGGLFQGFWEIDAQHRQG